jgi:DNA mismatch endonuclease (patch repair protein)
MTDVVSPPVRRRMMAGIRGKDTQPEFTVRRGLHRMGFRFRLHASNLPGRPDIVLPKYRAAIQVQGCFWHGHDCPLFRMPATRTRFWARKIERNRQNDALCLERLLALQFRVLIVWECSMKGPRRLPPDLLLERIASWVKSTRRTGEIRGTVKFR